MKKPEENARGPMTGPADEENTAVAAYLQHKAAADRADYLEFQRYLEEKSQCPAPKDREGAAHPGAWRDKTVSRRDVLKLGAAGVAGAALAKATSAITAAEAAHPPAAQGVSVEPHYQAPAQISREVVDPHLIIGGKSLGNWILLVPTKMGGGTNALDLNSGRTLASIWYWNYGDFNPISHHLCAFPSAEPLRGFEFVNSTQGGQNALIYGIPTKITDPAGGFNIYKVRFDGTQMEMVENVAETTGLGLGVHVCINPANAQSYFVTDGQKDIAACFDRQTSKVIAALKYDWEPKVKKLEVAWQQGGTLKISKIYPDPKTGKYDYEGTKGQKIDWEMVPMGELFVEQGQIPGDDALHLSGADGTIWHPGGRWASTIVRLCGGQVILDAEKGFEPVTFLQFNSKSPDQYPITKIDNDHWEIKFDRIHSPGHEVGFSPDGKFLCMMNNLRENSLAVFATGDPDPKKWKKIAQVADPLWRGRYPNPFHMVFSMDGSKLYVSVLHPSPAPSGLMVVDTGTWTIRKEIQGIGPDLQTLCVTYDGNYLLAVFSGFQRYSSGIAVIDTATDELLGILPSPGGHHDCVIIPTKMEHMRHTRSVTL